MNPSRGLYLRVGVLVLLGGLLAVGFLVFLTAGQRGGNLARYETYVSESVQGLDVGSQVRYRGVLIGRVSEIGLASALYRRASDEAYENAFRLVVVRFQVNTDQLGMTPELDEAIRLGLRVRLSSQGISGVSYLEVDFVNPMRFPAAEINWQPRDLYVPSIPSTVNQVKTAAEDLLQQLQDADIRGLLQNTNGFIGALRRQAEDGDLARTLREAAALVATLRQAVQGADLAGTLSELRGAAAEARSLMASRDLRNTLASAARTAAELQAAAARLPGSITQLEAGLRNARSATSDVQADLAPILRDLRTTMGNLRDTTELLRRYPGQAILGAPPPAPAAEGGRR
jgi:ABC-type transporter Mla subunit MlaD